MKSQRGFTLIELLIVVSLIIITVGVTGDIIISLVRSYNKTQITNEIEQNANFVMTKLEKELRNATSVDTATLTTNHLELTRRLETGGTEIIEYDMISSAEGGIVQRTINGGAAISLNNISATNPEGASLDIVLSSFTLAGTNPTVIDIVLRFTQVGNVPVQFAQDITLESTVVVRGSY